jgi:hypothetical protein
LSIAHLEKYEASPPELGPRPTKPMNRSDFDDLPETPIERIIAQKRFRKSGGKNRVWKYKVRWEGMDPSHDEWLTKTALRNAPDILAAWEHAHPQKP